MGCADSQVLNTPRRSTSHSKRPHSSFKKLNRLFTKFLPSETRQITDEEKKAGFSPTYTCPICTNRFNKILACEECQNCICLNCYIEHEKKAKKNFKCSFCTSEKSHFIDYTGEPHSYFDTTGNGGFLSKEERNKVEEKIKNENEQKLVLGTIQEIEAS